MVSYRCKAKKQLSKNPAPEKMFEHGLSSNTITNYFYDYKQGMYYYDFAFPDQKIDIEIDGDFHNKPERIIKDRLRDEYSISLGWKVFRFEARLIQKALSYCIDKVKYILNNSIEDISKVVKYTYKDYILENKKAAQ